MNVFGEFGGDQQTIRKCVNTATTSLQGLDQTKAVMEIPTLPHLPMDEIAMTMADVEVLIESESRLWSVPIISFTMESTLQLKISRRLY